LTSFHVIPNRGGDEVQSPPGVGRITAQAKGPQWPHPLPDAAVSFGAFVVKVTFSWNGFQLRRDICLSVTDDRPA